MTVICNIQAMLEKIGRVVTFKQLENKSINELWTLQERLITDYNKAVGE